MSQAELYGKGVFSTVRITGGQPFLWEKHWRRLLRDAEVLSIDLSRFDESSVNIALERSLAENDLVDGRARITFHDESPSALWRSESDNGTRMSILIGDLRRMHRPFRISVSPYSMNSRSPLAGVKSCNYLEHLMALDEAKRREFHEAIRLNERGIVTSACMANVFWLEGGRLFTPPLETGCLPGTTREFVLESLDCEEVKAEIEELEKVDAIFLTSAGLGIVQVDEFDSRTMPERQHPITDILPGRR